MSILPNLRKRILDGEEPTPEEIREAIEYQISLRVAAVTRKQTEKEKPLPKAKAKSKSKVKSVIGTEDEQEDWINGLE